jgi:hypothetical protein
MTNPGRLIRCTNDPLGAYVPDLKCPLCKTKRVRRTVMEWEHKRVTWHSCEECRCVFDKKEEWL